MWSGGPFKPGVGLSRKVRLLTGKLRPATNDQRLVLCYLLLTTCDWFF
jgi:hypothetical protein